jgi:hypothetical protein
MPRRCANGVTFNWEMISPKGDVLATGLEFLIVDDRQRILVDYQFIVNQPGRAAALPEDTTISPSAFDASISGAPFSEIEILDVCASRIGVQDWCVGRSVRRNVRNVRLAKTQSI